MTLQRSEIKRSQGNSMQAAHSPEETRQANKTQSILKGSYVNVCPLKACQRLLLLVRSEVTDTQYIRFNILT